MVNTTLTFTVYFEAPFWVGVFERVEDGALSAYKHTFGAEPTNTEVLALVQQLPRLQFSQSVAMVPVVRVKNPKRRQREARKAADTHGVGTRAQQALAAQHAAAKLQRASLRRDTRLHEQAKRYAKKCAKRKAKHRGH